MGHTFITQFIRRIYSNILKYLVGLVLACFLTVFVICFFVPFILLRRIIFHSAKYLRTDLGKMVDARGTLALIDDIYQSPRGKMVVGYVVEGSLSLKELRKAVACTLQAKDEESGKLLHPELVSDISIWCGFPFWAPLKDFHIDDYVSLCDITCADQTTAINYMKTRSLQTLCPNEPLWKVSLIPNYIPPNEYCCQNNNQASKYSFLVLEAHHSLVDGFSLMKLVFKFFKVSNKLPDFSKKRTGLEGARFSFLKSLLKTPYDIGEAFIKRSKDGDVWKLEVNPKAPNNESSMYPTPVKTYSSAPSDLMLFSKIKEIRLKHNVSTLAVICAAICGAIRKEMFKVQKDIPQKLKFAVILELPGHPDKLRNHWTAAPLPLPISDPNPLTRLTKINHRLCQLKRSSIPSLTAYLGVLVGSLPLPLSRYLFTKPISGGHIAILSSFPGPPEPMMMFDSHKCPEGFGMCSAMMGTAALAFSFVTYAGQGRLFMGADTSLIPTDVQASLIAQEFSNQLDLLFISDPQIPETV